MASSSDIQADETTSLLHSRRASQSTPVAPAFPHFKRTAFAVVLIIFVCEIGDFMTRAPWVRILESILCERYYDGQKSLSSSGPIPENLCKVAPVQDELAQLTGVDIALQYIPSLLLTVPYGILAEKRGRKLVLCLSLLGVTLQTLWVQGSALLAANGLINYKWFLAGNAFFMIGGGSSVVASMVYTIATDISPAAQLSNVYFLIISASLVPAVFSVPLAALLMRKSVWLPMLMGTVFVLVGAAIALLLPETHPSRRSKVSIVTDESAAQQALQQSVQPRHTLLGWVRTKAESYAFLTSSPLLLVLAPTYLISQVGADCMRFILPLASARFGWELSKASFLLPVLSVATLVLLLIILPLVTTTLIQTYRFAPTMANLTIARGSIILLVLGFVGIAVAPNVPSIIIALIIYAFGSGFAPSVRSIAASLVPTNNVAKLFAAYQTIATIGGLINGPVLSEAYVLGFGWGGLWSGLPFLVSGIMYACVAVVIMLVKLPLAQDKATDGAEDTQDGTEQPV